MEPKFQDSILRHSASECTTPALDYIEKANRGLSPGIQSGQGRSREADDIKGAGVILSSLRAFLKYQIKPLIDFFLLPFKRGVLLFLSQISEPFPSILIGVACLVIVFASQRAWQYVFGNTLITYGLHLTFGFVVFLQLIRIFRTDWLAIWQPRSGLLLRDALIISAVIAPSAFVILEGIKELYVFALYSFLAIGCAAIYSGCRKAYDRYKDRIFQFILENDADYRLKKAIREERGVFLALFSFICSANARNADKLQRIKYQIGILSMHGWNTAVVKLVRKHFEKINARFFNIQSATVFSLAALARIRSNQSDAYEYLCRRIHNFPKNPYLKSHLGEYYWRRGQLELAHKSLLHAMVLDSNCVIILNNLALLHLDRVWRKDIRGRDRVKKIQSDIDFVQAKKYSHRALMVMRREAVYYSSLMHTRALIAFTECNFFAANRQLTRNVTTENFTASIFFLGLLRMVNSSDFVDAELLLRRFLRRFKPEKSDAHLVQFAELAKSILDLLGPLRASGKKLSVEAIFSILKDRRGITVSRLLDSEFDVGLPIDFYYKSTMVNREFADMYWSFRSPGDPSKHPA